MQSNNEDIEIDLRELVFVLLRKVWIILIAGLICALAAGLISKFILKPIYTSSTKIYVINRQNTETTITNLDLETSTQLTKDYQILITSRPVIEQVIEDLNLDMTYEELVSSIKVNTPTDTRILEIEVEYTDSISAKKIVDSIAEVSAERMVSIMEMEKANIVEQGNIPANPSSPNVIINTMIGGVIGLSIAVIIILLSYILDDSIKSAEDIERYLGITILGSIPYEESVLNSRKLKRELKKAYKRGYKGGGMRNAVY